LCHECSITFSLIIFLSNCWWLEGKFLLLHGVVAGLEAAQLPGFQPSLAKLTLTENFSKPPQQCEGPEFGVVGREAGVTKERR
jgi:hypothetical protein